MFQNISSEDSKVVILPGKTETRTKKWAKKKVKKEMSRQNNNYDYSVKFVELKESSEYWLTTVYKGWSRDRNSSVLMP